MPELPEVETIRRALEKQALGCRITNLIVLRKDYIQTGLKQISSLKGLPIEAIGRRGKILAVHLTGGWILLHHLGMSGRILLKRSNEPIDPHTHIRILLDDGVWEIRQCDARRFGYLAVMRESDLDRFSPWTRLGVDALDLRLSVFCDLLRQRKQPIKSFLLDQRPVAGLGNIYADESLFRAGIHPLRPAGSLSREETKYLLQSIQHVLRESISAGGSTINDYQSLDGSLGEFQRQHRVYGKAGDPCPNCGALIEKIIVGGRSAHFCRKCQSADATRIFMEQKENR